MTRFVAVLAFFSIGAAWANASAHVEVSVGTPQTRFRDFERVLVAGFLASGVPQVSANEETARLLRTELRSKRTLSVIELEPLELRGNTPPSQDDPVEDDRVFSDVGFWKRIGEEYGEPLIVTGTVDFQSAGHRLEERPMGRRTVRVWRPGFKLALRLIFIDGRSGHMIESVAMRQRSAYATDARESPLSLYFKLMDAAMPSVLDAFAPQAMTTRVLLQ